MTLRTLRSILLITASGIASLSATALISFVQALQKHGVPLTKTALIDALQNSNPEVRWLAAAKLLVNDHALETIPSIRNALEQEAIPDTKINMAFSLAQVGDDLGFATLQTVCQDPKAEMALKLKSIGYSLQAGREFCIGTLKEALRPMRDDVLSHTGALAIVPSFRNLSSTDSRAITELVVEDLDSEEPVIRLHASQALGLMGKVSAVPKIK